ncbi:MAG TPA: hypothetical protein PKA80_02060, partial [Ignavibacteriaceae bacterium]|nr:hypothetical protein [Ignavibacteriaceae bacterium]
MAAYEVNLLFGQTKIRPLRIADTFQVVRRNKLLFYYHNIGNYFLVVKNLYHPNNESSHHLYVTEQLLISH